MKTVKFAPRVKDLYGLYTDLKKSAFAVRNVGADDTGTYVYLEDAEEKDPAAFVESWAEKPAPSPSDKKAFEKRKVEAELLSAPVAAESLSGTPSPDPASAARPADGSEPEPGKKPSLLAKMWRKIF